LPLTHLNATGWSKKFINAGGTSIVSVKESMIYIEKNILRGEGVPLPREVPPGITDREQAKIFAADCDLEAR
jgi:hypothetical protein